MQPDGLDHKIIALLEQNARAPVQTLASATGKPASTVYHRIKKLEESGVIEGYTVKLDEKTMGKDFTVYVLVSGSTGNYLDENFLEKKEVTEVVGVTGEYDILLKMQFADILDYNKFLTDFRQEYVNNIRQTVTMVRTERIK